MRTILVALFMVSLFSLRAYDQWYDSPVEAPPGISLIGSSEGKTIRGLSMQVRAATDNDSSPWGIIWDMKDSSNFTRARFTIPKLSKHDDAFSNYYGIVVERIQSDSVIILQEILPGNLLHTSRGYNTLKLVSDAFTPGSARLYAGQKELELIGDFSLRGGNFAYLNQGKKSLKLIRETFEIDTISVPMYSPSQLSPQSTDSPSDSVIGEWEFLDRDIKNTRNSLGGKYTLSILPNSKGGYAIIYQSGAEVNSRLWQPGCLKGELQPTSFAGDYDLIWYDAEGRKLQGEQNASLNEEATLLTLNLPLAQATIRFRRKTR